MKTEYIRDRRLKGSGKSQLLGLKWVFRHQDSQMFGLKFNKYL